MEEVLHWLQGEMERPGLFSWFHLLFLALILVATVLVSVLGRNAKYSTYRRILFFGWLLLIVMEVVKQLVRTFHYGSPSYWEYDFYHLPFHMCSMPLYLLPIVFLTPEKKRSSFTEAIEGFLSLYVLFAGLLVVLYNDVVMSTLTYTNIQSMIHHGTQVVLGVYILVYRRACFSLKTWAKSIPVFLFLCLAAILVNCSVHVLTDGIDMFYLNPFSVTSVPGASYLQGTYGFWVYLLLYLLALTGVALLTYGIYSLIRLIVNSAKKKRA